MLVLKQSTPQSTSLAGKSRWHLLVLTLALACGAHDALALGPLGGGSGLGLGLPGVSRLGGLNDLHLHDAADAIESPLGTDPVRALQQVRASANALLLRTHRDVLEADPQGAPVRRHQLLAWSPAPAALAAARQLGLEILQQREFAALGETLVVFSVPPGVGTASVLAQLRAADPTGEFDFNHLYAGSGASQASALATTQAASGAALSASSPTVRIGMVDSGVATHHPALRASSIRQWGCDDKPVPAEHGTAVASLIAGQDGKFHGAATHAQLYAADVYCGLASGGAADQIAAALAWMASEGVGVINLSLVGPANRTLQRVVAAMLRHGHILTAAVGNDGPNAPPLYPASYPGVVGVSAVDLRRRPLPEAARGAQVMFAAPGSDMLAAKFDGEGYQSVRGTSFAAPIVAALLAQHLPAPDPEHARHALASLAHEAAGKDYRRSDALGWGVVGEAFRVVPGSLQ